jgi:hypothetical protein
MIQSAARLKRCNLDSGGLILGQFQDAGPTRPPTERWRVQSSHQRGTCLNRAGREGVGDGQSRSRQHFNFSSSCALHNCRRNRSDPEGSGIVQLPVRSPKGLDAHVSKSGEICGPKCRNLYLLSVLSTEVQPSIAVSNPARTGAAGRARAQENQSKL